MTQKWTKEHSEEAQSQGWDLFSVDGNPNRLQIQKLDEFDVFVDDGHAKRYVKLMSESNCENFSVETCKTAIILATE